MYYKVCTSVMVFTRGALPTNTYGSVGFTHLVWVSLSEMYVCYETENKKIHIVTVNYSF